MLISSRLMSSHLSFTYDCTQAAAVFDFPSDLASSEKERHHFNLSRKEEKLFLRAKKMRLYLTMSSFMGFFLVNGRAIFEN